MKGGGIMGGNLEYNYSKLRGRIVEIFETQQNFAKEMGWSEHTLSSKLNHCPSSVTISSNLAS